VSGGGAGATAVQRLARLDACAVSDALDALGLDGVADGLRPLTGPARISGRVVTVELGRPAGAAGPGRGGPADGGRGGSGGPGLPGAHRHLGTAAILGATPGDVIVVAHQGRTDSAGWGGNLARAARRAGVAGVIVDGAARDIDEARDIGFPVFATAATPRTARGRTVEVSWGEPIVVAGGLAVAPGDLVVADSTGVVFVAAGRVEAVLERAEAIVAKEAAMAAAIDAGTPVDEVMGADYERMLR
jgi:4-hydroxy-4-methyl-2-oxoglutarate aldolase